MMCSVATAKIDKGFKASGAVTTTPLAHLDAQASTTPDYKVEATTTESSSGAFFPYTELVKKPVNLDRTQLEVRWISVRSPPYNANTINDLGLFV